MICTVNKVDKYNLLAGSLGNNLPLRESHSLFTGKFPPRKVISIILRFQSVPRGRIPLSNPPNW
jgi:hypothetical protein